MITQQDKNYLSKLQTQNPEIYDFVQHLLDDYRQDTRLGCHDIANIISLIFGNFQLLELTTPGLSDNPRWAQMNEDLRYLVATMEAISFYRYANTIKPEEEYLHSFIQDKIEPMVKSPEYNKLHITIDICDLNPAISIDSTKIAYVIKSILDNIADNNCDANVAITICPKDNHLYFTISDDCSVISSDIMSNFFNPFNSDKTGHIGLSLSSSYQIMMAHNGSLEIFPIGDKGYSYVLSLPF